MGYVMAGQASELERLRLQSIVWEPAGRELLTTLPCPRGARAVDLGCGCLGWLRVLSEWAGDGGEVIGTDIDDRLLGLAAEMVADEGLGNVRVVRDDLFASALPPASFDLVHARFQIAPLGRADEILEVMARLVRPGGVLVLEDPDHASWGYQPAAPALERLIELVVAAFAAAGGDFDAGREQVARLRSRGLVPEVSARVIALEPGHPYLALPLQFSRSLEHRLLHLVDEGELDALRAEAAAELADSTRWGTTFTLFQAAARTPLDA